MEPSEVQSLTRGLARGHDRAFHRFHDLYFHRLMGYLLTVTRGDIDLAKESLQSTYIRVARYAKPMKDEAAFWRWLTKLSRTAAIDIVRRSTAYRSRLDAYKTSFEALNLCETQDLSLDSILTRALDTLSEDERRLVHQKYFENQSLEQIALIQGRTRKAIESQLARIRSKLRRYIEGQLANEEPNTQPAQGHP